jgi:hypothetical protein
MPTVTKTDRHIHWYRQKGKAVSVHTVKAYMASGGTAPLNLNPRYWMQVRGEHQSPDASFPGKDLQYAPNMRLGWPQNK